MIRPRVVALGLVCVVACIAGCPRQPTTEPEPEPEPQVEEIVDAPSICTAGCQKLDRCVPELAGEGSDPADVSARLSDACDAACSSFADQRSSLALRDCLDLRSCPAFWGCISAAEVRPWLATIAPVGDRSCANLCSQASACAIARECALVGPGPGPRAGPGTRAPAEHGDRDTCMQDTALRVDLEETCLLRCSSTPEDSRARTELIGCIDHGTCDGMLACLDSWHDTSYAEPGLVPGVDPTCDAFCTRAIVCGAAQEDIELEPEELDALKQRMTSTYIECTVQCGKDLDVGGGEARESFEACTAVEDCPAYSECALEV